VDADLPEVNNDGYVVFATQHENFAVSDLDQLKTVMRALQKISGVYQVSRM